MLKKILIALAVVIAGILIFAATKPDSFQVQRSATIKAPPEKVFAHINDLRSWQAWSPWEKKDPAMKRELSGAESGKGAVYAWDGNSDVGQGRMTITESVPPSKVTIALDFIKPFESHATAELTLQPKGDATDVTWSLSGPSPYFSKLMQVFFSMDSMVGKDFEQGLAGLKAVAEK
jgi:uncharacterized protein YndB with AHSA1/START domain